MVLVILNWEIGTLRQEPVVGGGGQMGEEMGLLGSLGLGGGY